MLINHVFICHKCGNMDLFMQVTAGLDGCLISNGLKTEETSLSLWKAKKKAELEEKLKGLQETKHQLVQILKQVNFVILCLSGFLWVFVK